MAGLEGLSSSVAGVVQSLVYVLIVIPIMIGLVFFVLWAMKNRRYIYNILIYRDLGNGKSLFQNGKAGYFRCNKILFGLIDRSGEERLETKGGWNKPIQIIESTSDTDMVDINFKKGFIVMQKHDDRKILVPITKVSCSNLELINVIASGDFRDSANRILQRNEKEMQTKWEQFQFMAGLLIIGIIMLIMIVLIIQFTTGSIESSWKHVLDAEGILQTAKNTATAIPSVAP